MSQGRYPSYLQLGSKLIRERAREAIASLAVCQVCPRNCRVDRLNGVARVCSTGRHAKVSSWFAHFGEEDCLRGQRGSGTIFFAFCNLECVFCQNHDTSQAGVGRELSPERLAAAMLELQRKGCHNINLVTPEHVVPQVLEALPLAMDRGLCLPIVYNTSAYDSLESLRYMEGIVDVYMPDFKVWTKANAIRYLKAKDYPQVAQAAVREMHRQVGDLVIDGQGLARRGVLVRYLVMPDSLDESRQIFRFLAEEISPNTYVNVMGQYRPEYRASQFPEINRCPSEAEMAAVQNAFSEAGLQRMDAREPHHGLFVRLYR